VPWQATVRRSVSTSGVGIHGGEKVTMRLRPAPPGTGIVFVRTDLGAAVPARAENARDQSYATTLRHRGAEVRTVEHLLAALAGLGVGNVYVDLDRAEVPVLDGSALPFVQMIRQAGIAEQGTSVPELRVLRPIVVGDGERWIELRPGHQLHVDYQVSYSSSAVGIQRFAGTVTAARFAAAIAPARSFGFLADVPTVRQQGTPRPGTPAERAVVGGDPLRDGALRFRDEFVRHKVLDLLGDLALLEYPLRAEVVAHKAGHAMHIAAVHELLAHPESWELAEPDRVAPFTVRPYTGERESEAALVG
jgi:UDP-3-O-[3-hydroxymyristoyl] N-acetylglucosamine deacetylase